MEDVSERKQSEQLLRSSLRQKELLLQELHHRVKNNFQIISSILHLQLNSAENEAIQQMLRISQNRIDAMSLIHENFYQSENLTRIPMQSYLQDLHIQLVSIYGQSDVESNIDAGDLELGLATAIPVGLMVNELITNSLLHAEEHGSKLTLRVTLQREEDATLLLSVEDNGPGFPDDFALETTESLGILIVHNLAHQLDGEVFFENREGAHTAVRFPLPREELGEGAGDGREG
jgi:two-component sensor histidine kinase